MLEQPINPSSGDPLAASRLLGTLDPDDRARLAERCVERRFEKGQTVYFEGDPAESMLVLTAGRLKVSTYSSDGNELVLSMVSPGETIGELGMLSQVPRSATVTAIEPSRAVTLSRSVVMELVERRPALAMAMLRQLADMVRRVTGVAADLVFLDLSQRVAKYLLEHAGEPSAELRITQTELASAIGASRQRVNACLQDFQRRHWISVAPRSIRIDDPGRLRRLLP